MKKILLTTTALIAFGIAPAAAADLAARPYTKAPAAITDCQGLNGFYLGAMGGYAQGKLFRHWHAERRLRRRHRRLQLADGQHRSRCRGRYRLGRYRRARKSNPALAALRDGFATWAPFVAASAMHLIRS